MTVSEIAMLVSIGFGIIAICGWISCGYLWFMIQRDNKIIAELDEIIAQQKAQGST